MEKIVDVTISMSESEIKSALADYLNSKIQYTGANRVVSSDILLCLNTDQEPYDFTATIKTRSREEV